MSTKKKNMKLIDLLDEDKPIAGQKYVCLSFISPEEIIKNKEIFIFDKFLKQFELSKSIEKFEHFINFICQKYSLNNAKLFEDLKEFCVEEKDNLFLTTLEDDFKSFKEKNQDYLDKEFNENYEFQTSTRGIKVRGVFPSIEEGQLYCKKIRESDENHDVYLGQVGVWMPFHPDAYKTGKVEYLEKELNELMHEKKKNDDINKENFNKRVKEAKENAIKENIEKAKQTGNKLMQSINEDGNLVNSDEMDVPGKNLLFGDGKDDDVATADLRNKLFNDDNVIIGIDKSSDHGVSEVLKSKGETSKDETSKNETSKDETSKDETSKDETSKDETSKDETSKD